MSGRRTRPLSRTLAQRLALLRLNARQLDKPRGRKCLACGKFLDVQGLCRSYACPGGGS